MVSKYKFFISFLFFSSFLFSSEIEKIYYRADEMNVNFTEEGELKGISLNGNVEIIYKDIHLFCEKAEFNKITEEIICEGKILIKSDLGDFQCENIRYSLKSGYGILVNSTFSSPPFYVKGKSIEKQGDKIIVENGFITTCELEDPHYKVGAEKITYVKNDYIEVEKTKVNMGKYNIFYFPKLKYNIKKKQPSVLAKTKYKTRVGSTLEIEFFQENKEEDIDFNEKIFVGNKGAGFGIGTSSEKNNLNFQALGVKKYDNDDFQPGFIAEFQKNYENKEGKGDIIFDWRWMDNNDFFNDFFPDEYYNSKSKTYNYFSITHNYKENFLNLNIRENAREPILNIEKLPEFQIFTPFKQVSSLPLFFSNDISFVNFRYNDNDYFRGIEKFVFENKENFTFFTVSPFVSFAGINYYNSSKNKFHYISDVGVKLSTVLTKETKNVLFTPSVSFLNRFTKYKPSELPALSPYEEMENGKFMEVNLYWNFFKNSDYAGNILVSNSFDFNRNQFDHTYIDYDMKINDKFSINGENEIDFNGGTYDFGVNNIIYKNGDFKYSFGTRYEEKEDIWGIENWVEKKINEYWKYRIGIYYDFETDNISKQSYEIWRNLHCLTLDFKISKDRDNFSFSFIVLPSIFF